MASGVTLYRARSEQLEADVHVRVFRNTQSSSDTATRLRRMRALQLHEQLCTLSPPRLKVFPLECAGEDVYVAMHDFVAPLSAATSSRSLQSWTELFLSLARALLLLHENGSVLGGGSALRPESVASTDQDRAYFLNWDFAVVNLQPDDDPFVRAAIPLTRSVVDEDAAPELLRGMEVFGHADRVVPAVSCATDVYALVSLFRTLLLDDERALHHFAPLLQVLNFETAAVRPTASQVCEWLRASSILERPPLVRHGVGVGCRTVLVQSTTPQGDVLHLAIVRAGHRDPVRLRTQT